MVMERTAAAPAMEMAMDAGDDSAPAPNSRMRAKSAAARGGTGGGGGDGVAAHAKIRSNFETTPLFLPSLVVGPTGQVCFPTPASTLSHVPQHMARLVSSSIAPPLVVVGACELASSR